MIQPKYIDSQAAPPGSPSPDKARHEMLTELPATAICGNDITSSCLYVSALAIIYSGKWAPLALLLVAGVLYLFRAIYAEIVGAVPLNGGAYNALLNTTSKFRASLAACLTILSYMATAVISSNEALHYLQTLVPVVPVLWGTIALLSIFAGLTIVGIMESARVATAIFIFHLTSMGLLMLLGLVKVFTGGFDVLIANFQSTPPHGFGVALFFGFCAAMLGISGFESSSNFVEEQAPGVFPKTLRNMWISVTVLNPGIALIVLMLIPIGDVTTHQEALLAHMGSVASGDWLRIAISIDAALVLSGAVLTSFVGVHGLVQRMTLDRCLPQMLLKKNRLGTTHRITLAFLALTISILLITKGDLKALAGVYTISFLAVMTLFGVGNVLLKVKRARLPRATQASWVATIVAILAVVAGLVGNAIMNPPYLRMFLQYFIPTVLVVSIMLWRVSLLRGCLFVLQNLSDRLPVHSERLSTVVRGWIANVKSQQVVYFTRGDNPANLNNALQYVWKNEHPKRVKVVIVAENEEQVPQRLHTDLMFLDEVYPDLEVEFRIVKGVFGPPLIEELSERWSIPVNLMFIGSPGQRFRHNLSDLGGVRLII